MRERHRSYRSKLPSKYALRNDSSRQFNLRKSLSGTHGPSDRSSASFIGIATFISNIWNRSISDRATDAIQVISCSVWSDGDRGWTPPPSPRVQGPVEDRKLRNVGLDMLSKRHSEVRVNTIKRRQQLVASRVPDSRQSAYFSES